MSSKLGIFAVWMFVAVFCIATFVALVIAARRLKRMTETDASPFDHRVTISASESTGTVAKLSNPRTVFAECYIADKTQQGVEISTNRSGDVNCKVYLQDEKGVLSFLKVNSATFSIVR